MTSGPDFTVIAGGLFLGLVVALAAAAIAALCWWRSPDDREPSENGDGEDKEQGK